MVVNSWLSPAVYLAKGLFRGHICLNKQNTTTMKQLLFILMLLPSVLKAESYTYNLVSLIQQGNDNFSIDKKNEIYAVGTISVDGKSITIDQKVYDVTPMKKDNCYRYKGGMIQLVYRDSKLVCVQHYNYGKLSNYRIKHAAEPLRTRNSG